MTRIIITTALALVLASPAFATGRGNSMMSDTTASSASGAAVANCGCSPGSAYSYGGNTSYGVVSGPNSYTGSVSAAGGRSTGHATFGAFGAGESTAGVWATTHGTH